LQEIEEFLMPIVDSELPLLSGYLTGLIDNCRETGYFGAEAKRQ
jgi:hypothetical protein